MSSLCMLHPPKGRNKKLQIIMQKCHVYEHKHITAHYSCFVMAPVPRPIFNAMSSHR
jgi:hypothetical protein